MAYDVRGLRAMQSLPTAYPASAGAGYREPRLLGYATADTLAAVATAGYFNAAAAHMLVGDVMIINHTQTGAAGTAMRTITGNDGTTVTIAALG